jgi:hypothetical protein
MTASALLLRGSAEGVSSYRIFGDEAYPQQFGSTNKKSCEEFSTVMMQKFEMSMMGELNYFLGFQVKQLKEGTFISQTKYTQNLLQKVWDEGR